MTGPVRSVSHALAILRLLAETSPLSLSEIGRLVELSPSSCLNLLKTLVEEGVVERDPRGKRYGLAPAWAASGALRDGAAQMLVDRARPLMTQFAQSFDAAVGLWKMVSRERTGLIARAESDAGMRLHLADAQRQPLGGGAVGRALAAAQGIDGAELRRRFAPVRWQADLPFETYAEQVREAGRKGFAIDQGFAHRGVCTVAVGLGAVGLGAGFCLSASVLAVSRSAAEVEGLGTELLRLGAALASAR